jgi:hypothetical protein
MADDSCPFGDGALLESRASRGSFQTLRPLAEGTRFTYLAVGVVSQLIIILTVYIKKPEDIDMLNPVASNLGVPSGAALV